MKMNNKLIKYSGKEREDGKTTCAGPDRPRWSTGVSVAWEDVI